MNSVKPPFVEDYIVSNYKLSSNSIFTDFTFEYTGWKVKDLDDIWKEHWGFVEYNMDAIWDSIPI